MKVGDLVKIKETDDLGVIVKFCMRLYIPAAIVYWLPIKDEAMTDLDDLELVK